MVDNVISPCERTSGRFSPHSTVQGGYFILYAHASLPAFTFTSRLQPLHSAVLAPSFESGQQRVVKQESRLRAKRCDSSSAVGKTGKTFPALLAAAKVHDIYEQGGSSV